MKKIATLLALTLVMLTGCKSSKSAASASAQKSGLSDVSFVYHAVTRGTIMDITITEKDTYPYKGRPGSEDEDIPYKETNAKDWDALIEETKKIDLTTLDALEAPSKKHQFDGALAATLTIKANGESYATHTFDHGNPPAEIKPLVDKIIEISELEKK
ncbi:hypothetical protein AM493_13620 [Flavobacterium akiainvivens]|uniref:Lipoprotein n=1 Tax=Flavobacterium akiainvivens TaxID=1202724 RepID=A0A0M8ME41_9FLAO|nr:hypothetical protein [Flavobacterium akiainvivens]KOS06954.1 hypothetical protein AM493_13620 [Flavobacterium akiainvivens]SFQ60074.1 hypothetical protein SAMN05444144_109156 [Flavobacterium akiainvivens]